MRSIKTKRPEDFVKPLPGIFYMGTALHFKCDFARLDWEPTSGWLFLSPCCGSYMREVSIGSPNQTTWCLACEKIYRSRPSQPELESALEPWLDHWLEYSLHPVEAYFRAHNLAHAFREFDPEALWEMIGPREHEDYLAAHSLVEV